MVEFHFLGTGNAGGTPLWGCDCPACKIAAADPAKRRESATAALWVNNQVTLIDAGVTDLKERFSFQQLTRILLTHFHMDHVQGLFPLRWSEQTARIPVYRPDDPLGADDLYKHPGVLEFQPASAPFKPIAFDGFTITPVALIHSKITQGYLIDVNGWRLAYLTDTAGLPEQTREFLQAQRIDDLILDCSEPPRDATPRNHNDLNSALRIWSDLGARRVWLTHISHRLDAWLIDHPGELPEGVGIAYDGLVLRPEYGV